MAGNLPSVNINQGNGNLGQLGDSEDGNSLLALSVPAGTLPSGIAATGVVVGPYYSVADAEADGITEAYDLANDVLAWQHIHDFYLAAGNGIALWILPMAQSVTMASICDINQAGNLTTAIAALDGKVRLVGVTRVADGGYTPSYADQFDQDVWDAIANLKVLNADAATKYRWFSVFVEGMDWQGNASSSLDLQAVAGLEFNRGHLVIGQDVSLAAGSANTALDKFAQVGLVLGWAAGQAVNRNIGRVKSGKIPVTAAGFSNGAAYDTLSDAQLNTLNASGYIFYRKHSGKAGWYYNDSHATCPYTDDYNRLERGRVMDKASRITHRVYLDELLDDIEVDQVSGQLPVAVCKGYQATIDQAIQLEMTASGEISGATSFVNPAQNILTSNTLTTNLSLVPKGLNAAIESNLNFVNPLNQ